jgi:hypothetical protein
MTMNFPEVTRKYLLTGLGATPDVVEALLEEIPPSDAVWSFTPDPQRFTLRGVVAHLADWESVFLDRLIKTRDEDEPKLLNVDEGQLAIDRDYANSDPMQNIARFRAGREILVQTLTDLPTNAWSRIAHREWGPMNILNQAVLILGHDGYHTQQIAQWLEAGGK